MAGLERSKYETGPTRTGTVSLQSCMRGKKKKSEQPLFFIKEISVPLPLHVENHQHIRKKEHCRGSYHIAIKLTQS